MDVEIAKKYYSRPEIQRAILNFAKNREIAVLFGTFFGKRPDIIEYISDICGFVKKGVTSIHISEEHWTNPLLLSSTISEEDKQKIRSGWDLILDLDGVDFEYAKIVGSIIIDYLTIDLKIQNVSIKFSGNKGFHIGIPFQAFSKNIIGIGETRKLFPDAPRRISLFLMKELESKIIKEILIRDKSIENISKKYNILVSDLKKPDGSLDYLKLIEIDTILIASRHLFRAPYSFNEKSGLVSIPIENNRIMSFKKDEAKPENVKPEFYKNHEFLEYNHNFGCDGNILLMKAYEEVDDEQLELIEKKIKKEFKDGREKSIIFEGEGSFEGFEISEEISREDFPEVINYVIKTDFVDGKKRALFLLLTFLYSCKWTETGIRQIINEWNDNQTNPLKPAYIEPQLYWFKNQTNPINPPNFDNDNYYKDIGITKKIIEIDKNRFSKTNLKNPLHFVFLLSKQKEFEKNKKK